MKFVIGAVDENVWSKTNFFFLNRAKISGTLHEGLRVSYCWQVHLWRKKKRNSFLRYRYTALNIYYIVSKYVCVNNAKGARCSFS